MKQLFPLAWAGLKSRKHSTALLLSAIILSVVFLTVMGLINSSSLYTIDVQNKDLYGEQKAIAWDLPPQEKDLLNSSSIWDKIGKMTVYGSVVTASDSFQGIGTMDEQAIEMGHIRLAEGRWPQAADEILLEKGAYKYTGNQPYSVGDSITLEVSMIGQEAPEQLTFQVVGLIDNYSAVWKNAYTHYTPDGVPSSPLTVSFVVSEQNDISGEYEETWLLGSQGSSYAVLQGGFPHGNSKLCLNTRTYPQINYFGGISEDAHTAIRISALFGGMIMVCMMAILLNGFFMSVDQRKRQFSLLRCIGATKKQACSYIFCEAVLLLCLGVPLGLIIGVSLSLGVVKIFSVLSGVTSLLYHFNPWILVITATICVCCVCAAVLLPALRASRSTPVTGIRPDYPLKDRKRKASPKSREKLNPFTLMLIFIQRYKGKTALTTATFAMIIVVFNILMMTDIVDYQMDSNYRIADISLTALETSAGKKQGFLWEHNTKENTIPVAAFEAFGTLPDIAWENAIVFPMFYCRIPFSCYDDYLNGKFGFDYKLLGVRNWERWGRYNYSFEEQTLYGYTDREYLTTPNITIFDNELLSQFTPFVTDGRVDIEAIGGGEEIILCMPDYYSFLVEEDDGIQRGSRILNGKIEIPENARLVTNTNWKAGDTITFTWPESQGNGYILHERTVKVGAIVKDAPKFDHAFGGIFSIAVGENTLDNMQVPYEISNLYLYFDMDADITATEAEVEQRVSACYPLTRLSTKTEEALAEQRKRRTYLSIYSMITFSLLVLGFLGLLNTVSSRIHSRQHEIGLLRCIGMTKGQIYRMYVYEGVLFGVLASLFGIAGSFLMLSKFQESWVQTQMPLYLVFSCIFCIALAVCTVFLPVRTILKKNPTEILNVNV